MKTVIHHLRRAALLHQGEGPSDSQLLESFLTRREDACFEALLRRHGPMVLGVCRRVLHNVHDAEDAFQATFLVLVRKASSLRSRDLLANWLYGVAYRIAMKARAMNAKRRAKERHAGQMPRSEAPSASADETLLAQLDHELNRLPEKYRVPLVLCELQGRSRKEAARQLELPEGTLSWRLAQGKKLLAKRLSRHGTALSVGTVAAAMTEGAALAGLSPALRTSTLQTVFSAGTVPANVLALTDGVLKAMLLTKLKITVCAAAVALVAGVGASGLTYRATAEEPKSNEIYFVRRADPRPQNDDLDALRLEIEALRKELRATRERVKQLEDEVRGPKKVQKKDSENPNVGKVARTEEGKIATITLDPQVKTFRYILVDDKSREDLLGAAQEALKKLRANPRDKQAAEAVERALKWLKEQGMKEQGTLKWKWEKSEKPDGGKK